MDRVSRIVSGWNNWSIIPLLRWMSDCMIDALILLQCVGIFLNLFYQTSIFHSTEDIIMMYYVLHGRKFWKRIGL